MPQPQKQLDPQSLERLLARWVTVKGRRLCAAGHQTLSWLVTTYGYRWTTISLEDNPWDIDPRCMMRRLRRLQEDGVIKIHKVHRGRRGGVELRVHNLEAIDAYRQAERDRDKWLLQFADQGDEPPATLPIGGGNPAQNLAREPDLFADLERNPTMRAGFSSGNPALMPKTGPDLVAQGASPELAAAIAAGLTADQIEVWLVPARFAAIDAPSDGAAATQVYLPSEFKAAQVERIIGRQLRAAVREAGLGELTFQVDASLQVVEINPAQNLARGPDFPVNYLTINSTEPLKGSVEIEFKPNEAPPPRRRPAVGGSEFGEHPLLRSAESLYDAVGQAWPFRWYAIAAMVLLTEGAIARADVDAQLAEPKLRAKLLPGGIQRLAGDRWLKLPAFKKHLAERYGLAWQEHWAGNRKPDSSSSERKPR